MPRYSQGTNRDSGNYSYSLSRTCSKAGKKRRPSILAMAGCSIRSTRPNSGGISEIMTKNEESQSEDAASRDRLPAEVEEQIFRAISRIHYGSIEIVIHDGCVVQIECREKIRL